MSTFIVLCIICVLHLCSTSTADRLGVNGTWKLHTIDLSVFPKARCLDGSPGAFWFKEGSGSGKKSFFIHKQGGAWCTTIGDCYQRSLGSLGSTSQWVVSPDCSTDTESQPCKYDNDGGMHASDLVGDWNILYIGYCDGASYAGAVEEPIRYNNTNLYFRGSYILDAIYEMALSPSSSIGMSEAENVVISGTSAGGLAVYLHADNIAGKIRQKTSTSTNAKKVNIVAVPDAGFFLDYPSINGTYLYTPRYKQVYFMHNVSGSVNQECLQHYKEISYTAATTTAAATTTTAAAAATTTTTTTTTTAATTTTTTAATTTTTTTAATTSVQEDESWKCFMAQYTLPFIKTPMFIVNSLADQWQGGAIMGIKCDPRIPQGEDGACSPDVIPYLNNFRQAMLIALDVYLIKPVAGAWLCECWEHNVAEVQHYWDQVQVQGGTLQTVFSDWLMKGGGSAGGGGGGRGGRGGREGSRGDGLVDYIRIDGTWGSNTC